MVHLQFQGKLCETGQMVTVTVEGENIASVEPIASAQRSGIAGEEIWIAPGFIDLQVNGYNGHNFNQNSWTSGEASPDAVYRVLEMAARAGAPLLCPTVVTNHHEGMVGSLRALARAIEADPSLEKALPGIHVEGPYFSMEDGPRGAHPLEHVRPPDWDEFQRFQEAAAGRVKIVTLAPEREGALPFIEKVVETGVVAAIGHSAATPAQIGDAVRAGASMSTHLGNGSHAVLPRHPNYIWEQLAHDELTAGVIADGHHLPPAVVKCFARVKGVERFCLVSDAVALGGLPPGVYDGGRHEVLPSGKVVLAGTPYLAGAGHLLDTCVANAIRWTDLGIGPAVRAASETPARVLGLAGRKGRVAAGFDADISLFRLPAGDEPLVVVMTVRSGEVVYKREADSRSR